MQLYTSHTAQHFPSVRRHGQASRIWTLASLLGLVTLSPVAAQASEPTSEVSLAAGFESRRIARPERVMLQYTDDCGYVPAEPIAIVTLEEDFFYLNFSVLDATQDTTLLVVSQASDDDRFCSRGEMGQSGYWNAGTYKVYVGGMTEPAALGQGNTGSLEISENP